MSESYPLIHIYSQKEERKKEAKKERRKSSTTTTTKLHFILRQHALTPVLGRPNALIFRSRGRLG